MVFLVVEVLASPERERERKRERERERKSFSGSKTETWSCRERVIVYDSPASVISSRERE